MDFIDLIDRLNCETVGARALQIWMVDFPDEAMNVSIERICIIHTDLQPAPSSAVFALRAGCCRALEKNLGSPQARKS